MMTECGKSIRTLQMPGCADSQGGEEGNDCKRSYHLYVPTSLCQEDNPSATSGTAASTTDLRQPGRDDVLPLVFAFHCLGCTANTMLHWTSMADTYHFVLVVPEGLQSSWNAKDCCGYALENKIDDAGFVREIIAQLDGELEFVSRDVAYGAGWSNGGYLVTYLASMFRAVAPISGNVLPEEMTMEASAASPEDNIKPVGLFMHHAEDDNFVRITGCCTDPAEPRCCCGISSNHPGTCTSAMQVFEAWAERINNCTGTGTGGGGEGGGGMSQFTMQDSERGITCHSASGPGCLANATFCIHRNGAHFNRPSFEKAFPMSDDIGAFFAADACSVNGGTWSSSARACSCGGGTSSPYKGRYCLVDAGATKGGHAVAGGLKGSGSPSLFVVMCILLLTVAVAVRVATKQKKSKAKYKGWARVAADEDDMSGTEMQDRNRVV